MLLSQISWPAAGREWDLSVPFPKSEFEQAGLWPQCFGGGGSGRCILLADGKDRTSVSAQQLWGAPAAPARNGLHLVRS